MLLSLQNSYRYLVLTLAGLVLERCYRNWAFRGLGTLVHLEIRENDLWYLGGGAYQPWTFGYTGRAPARP